MTESNITPIRPEEAENAAIRRWDMQLLSRCVDKLAATMNVLQLVVEITKLEDAIRMKINNQQPKAGARLSGVRIDAVLLRREELTTLHAGNAVILEQQQAGYETIFIAGRLRYGIRFTRYNGKQFVLHYDCYDENWRIWALPEFGIQEVPWNG